MRWIQCEAFSGRSISGVLQRLVHLKRMQKQSIDSMIDIHDGQHSSALAQSPRSFDPTLTLPSSSVLPTSLPVWGARLGSVDQRMQLQDEQRAGNPAGWTVQPGYVDFAELRPLPLSHEGEQQGWNPI